MQPGRHSETALRAARARARHQILDRPRMLDDPFALSILGEQEEAAIRASTSQGGLVARALRGGIVARSRIAEDALARSLRDGMRQYVVLGAGLDTFALRADATPADLRVFEVDHPDTQRWKRQLLANAGIAVPQRLEFVPVDFMVQALGPALAASGFDASRPAFLSWLGVTMYLPRTAMMDTLRFVASLAPSTRIAFDCVYRPSPFNLPGHLVLRALSRRFARMGEPWHIHLQPRQLAGELRALGFRQVETISTSDMRRRALGERANGLRVNGGRLSGMVIADV